MEKEENLHEILHTIPTSGTGGLREHFRVSVPPTNPPYCEIFLPAPKEEATTEYRQAYVLATNKIQAKIDSALKQKQSATNIVVRKGSAHCMQLNLSDVSMTGCSILNQDEEFSYFLRPNTIFNNCSIFIPNYGKTVATFKLVSKRKIDYEKKGEFNELIGILFVKMTQTAEHLISRYAQELERERVSMLRGYSPE